MFLRRMPLLEVRISVVDLSLQACFNVVLEDVAVLGECCPPGLGSSLNLLVLVFGSCTVSLSHVDVAFKFQRSRSVCRFPPSPLSSTCSSSDLDLHFHQLTPVAIVVEHVVYWRI